MLANEKYLVSVLYVNNKTTAENGTGYITCIPLNNQI